MKLRLAVYLLTALSLPAVWAHAHAERPLPAVGLIALSSGYVVPQSGTPSTSFTYRVKYWNTDNVPPDRVWVAIWWGSRGTCYWYEMQPFDPSDTNYLDGAWYTFSMSGLDGSPHFFRFATEVGAERRYWPQPEGAYREGPTSEGLTVRTGSVTADRTTGPQPSFLLEAGKAQAHEGDYITFTVTVVLPSSQTQTARGVTIAYTPDDMFDAVDGTAPSLIEASALVMWHQGAVRTPAATVRVVGRSTPILPAGHIFVAHCGDLAPGQSVAFTFRCRAK